MNFDICKKCCGVRQIELRYSYQFNELRLLLKNGKGIIKCSFTIDDKKCFSSFFSQPGRKLYGNKAVVEFVYLRKKMKLYGVAEKSVNDEVLSQDSHDFLYGTYHETPNGECPYRAEHFISTLYKE